MVGIFPIGSYIVTWHCIINALAVINEICNAIVLYVGPKYLHLPKANQEKKYKTSEFETKFWVIEAFGCIDGTHIPLHDFLNTLTVISVTNNSIHLAYKLYAFIKVLLWMLNITGLVVFTAQNFFQTLLLQTFTLLWPT